MSTNNLYDDEGFYLNRESCPNGCDIYYFIDDSEKEIFFWCFNCILRDVRMLSQTQLNNFFYYNIFYENTDINVLNSLLDNGANPNIPYDKKNYLIFDVCRELKYKKLEILLRCPNINVNVRNADGITPLEYIEGNSEESMMCAKLLIQSGCVDKKIILKCIDKTNCPKMLKILSEWENFILPEIKEPSGDE